MTKSGLDYAIPRIQLSPNYVLQARLLSNIRMMHINDQHVVQVWINLKFGKMQAQYALATRTIWLEKMIAMAACICTNAIHVHQNEAKTYVIVI